MFEKIIAPLDGSSLAESALPHLASLSLAYEADVTLVQVLECADSAANGQVDPMRWEMCKSEAEAYLAGVRDRLQETGVQHLSTALLEGQPAERICEYVRANDMDLVALSSHGKSGLSRWNVSSVARKVIQHARVSTLLARAYRPSTLESPEKATYTRLMVPLDGSKRAECALPVAVTLARFFDAQLLIGQVIAEPETPRMLPLTTEDRQLVERFVERSKKASAKYMEELQDRLSFAFEQLLEVSDDTAAALHEMVQKNEIDLVVLSAHGYSGKTKWPFGSITTSFIEYGGVPLLMIQDLEPEEVEESEAEEAAKEKKGH